MMSASVAVVTVELTVNGQSFINESRWVKEDPSRKSIPEFEDGGNWLGVCRLARRLHRTALAAALDQGEWPR